MREIGDLTRRRVITDPRGEAKTIESRLEKKTDRAQVAVEPVVPAAPAQEPDREEIAALAYEFWIERGSPHGSHEEDWQRAEEQLRGNGTKTKTAGARRAG